jgi:nucleoside 2-deoxyribosyltransferase
MRTLYLAGPINACTDHVANGWRNQVIDWHRSFGRHRIIELRNPMDRDYRGIEGSCAAEIVELDKRDIRESDVMLVRWLKPSVGTSMEILYAYERDIPVILWLESRSDVSPWLIYHASCMVLGFDQAMEQVERFTK